MSLSSFHPVVRAWFEETYGTPSPPQAEGWPVIAAGRSALILAPTGSGKTLAAFLKCLDELYQRPGQGVQVLYISPLKALNNDIHRNLAVPLSGIEEKAAALGVKLPTITTAVRTGDTLPRDRAAMLRKPPHVLITTPESLYLLLTSRAREMLRTVRYVILDEIHAVCAGKRGVHLSLSLERLEALLPRPPVRIGLSATQRPLEEIARYLGGVGRDVAIIDTGTRKQLDLRVEVAVDDMRALPDGSIWGAIQPRLLELIRQHTSTLVFVNYRGLAERLAGRLNAEAGQEIAKVHHGSMSRTAREQVEQDLKAGRLPCLVATASLEMGIDIGAIDLVVQVESPKSAARGLQRVGRAGHVIGAASKGRILPKWRGDLLEAACITREMLRGQVEETRIPTGALDVLAQQVVAMTAMDEWRVADLLALLRRSYCYRDISERQLEAVLELLSGRYPAEELRDLRPRIVWDREAGTIRARESTRAVAIMSGGTIPDRGYYSVHLQGSETRLGEMDEEFVYESRQGDVFLLGTGTWRIESIEHDRITVSPAVSGTPRMPFWKGDGIGRPYEMGVKVGAFVREVAERVARSGEAAAAEWLQAECALDERAARNVLAYLEEQQEAAGVLPSDRQVVAEYFWDEMGDRRLVIHTPFGERVHLAWMVILRRRLRDLLGIDAELTQSDDAILIRLPGADAPPPVQELLRIDPAEAREMLVQEIGSTPLFGAYFRMNAGRALVLPRPKPGRRRPFWLQRLRAKDLLEVTRKYDSFPVVLETYREVLKDVLDMDGLTEVLTGVQAGAIGVHVTETPAPSPMAAALFMKFIGRYMYEDETPRAERRGALLGLNRELLREILGAEQLRELLDARAIGEVHARLQRLAPEWQPRNADEAEDLLRRLGDLSAAELAERGVSVDWVAALAAQRRAVRVKLGGSERWVSADDVGLYADPVGNAGAILRRFARNRGPFTLAEAAERYGLASATAERYLAVLQAEGAVSAGEYTPGRTGREFCDAEVLQQIHRRTLTVLRREIEPVDGAAYARFLLEWQGVAPAPAAGATGRGPHALRPVLARLQGLALPAEAWERDVLPRRVPGYQPAWLDQLCATGELHWAARPGGKLAFYLPEQVAAYAPVLAGEPGHLSAAQQQVVDALRATGADFLGGVARAAGLPSALALETLWELAWLGVVTNDTFDPVRQVLRATRAPSRGSGSGQGRPRPVPLKGSTGRWSLVARLAGRAPEGPPPAEAYAQALLDRYGVVARETVAAEDGPAPWADIAAVLRGWEMRGQIRQGYFIRELSGAQYALPDAVERLRAAREATAGRVVLLGACDPANPWGASVPAGPAGPSRTASAYLVLEDGRPVLAAESGGRRLSPLEPLAGDRLRAALSSLRDLLVAPATVRPARRVEVEHWGGEPILGTEAAGILQSLGFERLPTKLVWYL